MIDTLRVLVGWACNLDCSYCCNRIPEVRARIVPTSWDQFKLTMFDQYHTVCISGGEPLLSPTRTERVAELASSCGCFVVLYTNGWLLTPRRARRLESAGVAAVNVGLHDPATFHKLIARAEDAVAGTKLRLRFHVEDAYRSMALQGEGRSIKYWHRDECDVPNEEQVVIL